VAKVGKIPSGLPSVVTEHITISQLHTVHKLIDLPAGVRHSRLRERQGETSV
jgi:hypothetical protein